MSRTKKDFFKSLLKFKDFKKVLKTSDKLNRELHCVVGIPDFGNRCVLLFVLPMRKGLAGKEEVQQT